MKFVCFFSLFLLINNFVFAEETTTSTTEENSEPATDENEDPSKLEKNLTEKHHLTPEQIAYMKEKGMNPSEMNKTARIAEKSGKSIEEITKMRTEEKKGWGRICKDLGVHPSVLGHGHGKGEHGMAGLTEEQRKNLQATKKENRQEMRNMRKDQRQEIRAMKKEMRKENKAGGKK